MTCIDFAACFVKPGEEDPIDRQMEEFLKEEVSDFEFKDMPQDIKGYKQKAKI